MSNNSLPLPNFLKLRLTTQAIAIGERVKKGTFRPCVETIPTSTLAGCFKEYFGLEDMVAIGFFDADTYEKQLFTYAPFDAALGTAKLPLTIEYLAPREKQPVIVAQVYLTATEQTRSFFAKPGGVFKMFMGAMRSKGLGECELQFEGELQSERKVGYLRGNLRETDAAAFGISLAKDVIRPHYGYLFRPDDYRIGGKYEKALFAGTILGGPDFLLEKEYLYDL